MNKYDRNTASVERGSKQNGRNDQPRLMAIGSVQIDIKATLEGPACGVKRSARFDWSVGGSPCNVAKVAVAYGIPVAIIAPQASAMHRWCRDALLASGVTAILIKRRDEAPATTVALPNGEPGKFELYVQRVSPLRVSELSCAATRRLRNADVAVVGPIAVVDEETLGFYRHIGSTTRFRALFPHPNLVKHERFAEVARQFDYVQMNVAEAQLLDLRAGDITKLALRLRWMLEENVEFAITNGAQEGLLWARDNNCFSWHKICPTRVKTISDIGAGDTWGAAYLVHRRYLGKCAAEACEAATLVAGGVVSAGRPALTNGGTASPPTKFENRSWAEYAI